MTIPEALQILDLNADKIFWRIREDLDRGLVKEARSHLDFVDELLKGLPAGRSATESTGIGHAPSQTGNTNVT